MSLITRVALAAFVSLNVFSQQFVSAFSCVQTEAKAPMLRAGGGAELLGEITIGCIGGTPGSSFTTHIQVFTNFPIASKFTQSAGQHTEALLIVDDPTSPALGTNVYQGVLTAPNTVQFSAVSIAPPGSNGTLRLRIVNLRAAVPPTVVVGGLIPDQALAFVTAVSSSIPINNPQQIVGFVASGYQTQLLNSGGSPAQAITFGNAGGADYQVRFTEGFQAAFKKRNTATSAATPTALADQAQYGVDYSTESGFYLSTLPSTNGANQAGLATSGTRLRSVISNIPSGVQMFASTTQIAVSTGTIAARLIATDVQGAGTYSAVTSGPDGYAQIAVNSGTAIAVWEILNSDPDAIEQLRFGLRAVYSSTSSSAASVVSDLGPFSTVVQSDATAPIPRFQPQQRSGAFTDCTSNCISAPSVITFNAVAGGPNPAPITIPIASTGTNVSYQVSAASGHYIDIAPRDGAWLSVTPSQATTPGVITASVSTAGLIPGKYPGLITVTSGPHTYSIFVQLAVSRGAGGLFGASCIGNGGVPPIVRDAGITERLGDLVLNCVSDATTSSTVNTDVRISLYAPQTTRLLGNGNEALLLIDEPAQQVLGVNTFTGELRSPNELIFRNVPLQFSPSSTTIMRVTNLTVDASRMGVSAVLTPTQIRVHTRLSSIPNVSPDTTLGFVVSGSSFALETEAGSTASDIPLTSLGSSKGVLRFREGFASSYKRRNVSLTSSLVNQNIPGAIYNTETGFYNASFSSPTIGLADSGTRLLVRLNNIPAGVNLAVTISELTTGTPRSRLTLTDANGAGPYSPVSSTGTASFGSFNNFATAPLTVTNGTAYAVWEILDSNPLSAETFRFGIVATYTGSPAGAITAAGHLAPLSTVHTADFTSPVPRFDTQSALTAGACVIGPCIIAPSPVTLASTNGAQASTTISVTSNADPQVALITTQPSWLRVQNGVVTTPGQVTIIADPTGLANGTHSGQVTIGNNTTVAVNFTVQAPVTTPPPPGQPEPPSIAVSADLLQFTFTPGIAPAPIGLQIDGPAGLPFQIASSANWLTTTPSNGTLPATVRLVTNPGAVPAGEYEVLLTVTAPGAASRIVRVRVSITEPPQFIAIPSALNLTHTIGEPASPVTLYLTSKGRHGNVSVQALSDGNWLSVSPETGNTPMNIRVTINPANRAPGTYTGTIRIESLDKISAPISLPVTLVVREAASATTPAP